MSRYKIATGKFSKQELKLRKQERKKSYKYYQRNQDLRRQHSNIRQIRNGEVISTWDDK